MIRGMKLSILLPTALLLLVGAMPARSAETIQLFNGKDFTGWTAFFSDPNVKFQDVWSIKNGAIHCKGHPAGYIRTDRDFTNFILKFQWRTLKKGNSGCLIRVQAPDKVWPKSIECQLETNNAGDIWVIDGFPIKPDPRTRRQGRHIPNFEKSNEKPLGQWNNYEITADGTNLKLVVNGALQNQATDVQEIPGKILLQSEGAEIEFRNLELTELPAGKPQAKAQAAASAAQAEPEFEPLWNDKDLTGWSAFAKAGDASKTWTISDGILRCSGSPEGYLKTDKTYQNFILQWDWRWPEKAGDSGVFVRASGPDGIWPKSLEAQLAPGQVGDLFAMSGFPIFNDKIKGTHAPRIAPESEKPAGEWNHAQLAMTGNKAELTINGTVQNTITGMPMMPGFIALQSEGAPIEFRNVQIASLDNGAQIVEKHRLAGLKGWYITGNGNWTYRDGIIDGHQGKDIHSYTHVVSDKSYHNFKASMQYKCEKGNSGFYFRVLLKADGNVEGFQAEIDEAHNAGGLYESWGRGWVSLPSDAAVASFFKPGEWNQMTVEAHGPHVVVTVNGAKAAEINDPNVRMEGPCALQIHGGQDVHVMFKDIQIEELPN
jgi:hypothetical protein